MARCCSCVTSSKGESSDREDETQGVRAGQPEPPQYVVANARKLKLRELIAATDNFNQEHFLGEGKLGRVYKGILEDGQKIAVKKLTENTQQGRAEFRAEIQMLSGLEHSNIVKLIGYHDKGDVLFIVYEFMPSQSLDHHLYEHEISKKPLDWNTRMKIAEGVAKALKYLHDQKDPPIIYGDLKPSNILLDEKFNPKLSNFSTAKPGPAWNCRGASGKVMGTLGYGPPEHVMTGMLTRECDIYRFGVVFLELITGRKAIQKNLASRERSIVLWARPFLDTKNFSQIADPVLGGCYPGDGLAEALTVAEMCIQEDATKRPHIAKIVTLLSDILSEAEGEEAWDKKEA
ncbi:receptor-like cytoplasmic kinase 185 isoform X2 [Papaver somniferum]|uniref:receptor-like cytoplasmic kinase 185 isoform X2 n=1 Tax=Papaver somniferum TaxID=3469 RepID=UPI000E6FCD63|nr:receptor-like cytoplasmic kinase 185 isoform X2 [Papaver somniferum]